MVNFVSFEDLKNKKRALIFFTALGALNFIILTIIAVFFYPRPYNFLMEPFSILGLMDANYIYRRQYIIYPPLPNPISSVMFMVAIVVVAIATIPFWILLKSLFEDKKSTKIISYFGSILGVISAPFLIGVAFPADVYSAIHGYGTMIFFLLFSSSILIYSIAIYLNDKYPKKYSIFGIIVFLIGVAYVLVPYTPLNALHQKTTVYLFITWALVQALKLWKEI